MAESKKAEKSPGPPERSGGGPAPSREAGQKAPDPEVREKAVRRKFSADYKRHILEEADQCTEPGEIGALLRREGIYWSCFTRWRKQRREGIKKGLQEKKRGRKVAMDPKAANKINKLERENRQLRKKLEQAETLIEIQKKVSSLMEIELASPAKEQND